MAVSNAFTRKLVGSILGWFLLLEALLVAAAFAWVFLYSAFIHPGSDEAFYSAYAQRASPFVALVLAFPLFYWMGRSMGRFGDKALTAVFAVLGLNLALEVITTATMAVDPVYSGTLSAIVFVAKSAGAWFGVGRTTLHPA